MSRYLDLSQNCVLYGDTMLPQEAFFTSDTAEMKLVTCVFELAKSVAELKLTETELALYSACVLLSPGTFLILYIFLNTELSKFNAKWFALNIYHFIILSIFKYNIHFQNNIINNKRHQIEKEIMAFLISIKE